jgi:methyl-accepting chemotaxis protein
MGDFVTGNFSLYLATGINLVVGSGLILTLLHFVVLKPLKKTREMVHTVADKLDLTQRLDIGSNDEIGDMAADINNLMENMAESLAEVGKGSNQVSDASAMISTSTEQSTLAANEVARTIEESNHRQHYHLAAGRHENRRHLGE